MDFGPIVSARKRWDLQSRFVAEVITGGLNGVAFATMPVLHSKAYVWFGAVALAF